MKKHKGELIHSCQDEYGAIEVVDLQQRLRCLHFGNTTQQSTMFLFNPVVLVHKYTQAMLTPLCWQTPLNILVLGMGAGSLVKFLHHHFKQIHIDAVELRSSLVDIGREFFSLPGEDDRLKIHCCSAEDFIQKNADTPEKYDLILIDLFLTEKDQDINADISQQFSKLKSMLSINGCISINVLGEQPQQYAGFEQLQEIFQHYVYTIQVESTNSILLVSKQDIPPVNDDMTFFALEKRMELPFRQYFNKLKRL